MSSNPRIYIVITTFHPLIGGAEKQAFAQGRSLRQRGYVATIVTFHHDSAWPSHEVLEGVPVMRVAGFLLGNREKLPRLCQRMLYLLALCVMGWTLLRKRRCYDILHVYQLNLLALPTGLVCLISGKPMLIAVRCAGAGKNRPNLSPASLHGRQQETIAQMLEDSDRSGSKSDLEDLERCGKLVVRFTRSLLIRTGAVVTVLSSGMRCYLAEHNFELPHVQLIPNGVDTRRFAPCTNASSHDERAKIVICVSRLCYQKGIDVLLYTWQRVHAHCPHARLLIVGEGPLQQQLEDLSRSLDIAECVEFTGSQSDVVTQLHRGGMAVLPSRWEGMPNAVLEAMSCGLPCVATRVSGSEDIIQHEVNGLLVKPEDDEGMAQALLTLLSDPVLTCRYGEAARATIEQYYSLDHITNTYITLYQDILKKGAIEDEKSPQGVIARRK